MAKMPDTQQKVHDVIIIGAGVCGVYQLHSCLKIGLDTIVLESGSGLGGTWFFNRYPGARFDSESYTYGYSFSQEVLDEWNWSERFAAQPETLEYLNFVAEKFALKKHMKFDTHVSKASYDPSAELWRVTASDGNAYSCRALVTAIGMLSAPTLPNIPGKEDFEGSSFHTFYWPREGLPLSGKRVAVIGTGASGIQVISEIAEQVEHLTVFQRRPNWVAPLNNSKISDEEMENIRARYDEIFELCAQTPGGFEHSPDRRGFWDVPRDERVKLWDKLYDEPGFGIWLQNFREIFTDKRANAEFSEYMADRIRERVNDPNIAEKLIPKDHGFGVQRVPLETNYLEVFNRSNVNLVSLGDTPIERITKTGVKTTDEDFEFDLIIYATGFDAITGAYDKIRFEGRDQESLFDKWESGVATFLGIMTHGFPNLFMPTGPQSGSASINFPRGIENGVNWVTELLSYMREKGYTSAEPTREAEIEWVDHVREMYGGLLMRNAKSWFTGYNSNVKGHEAGNTRYVIYNGGAPKYVRLISEVASKDYRGVRFRSGKFAINESCGFKNIGGRYQHSSNGQSKQSAKSVAD